MSDSVRRPAINDVRLRTVERGDLPTLYRYQLDPEANRMAAVNPRNLDLFYAHWTKIFNAPNVIARAILADGVLAGHISCFRADDKDYVGYWIDREHWGRGIASRALALLLDEVPTRPLYARVASHNVASLRVLTRFGFVVTHYQVSPPDERYLECEEAFLVLA
jgi:RimJ/RimL family protein N-acetyltransferase